MPRKKKGRNRSRSGGWSRRKDGRLAVYVTVDTYDGPRQVTTTLPRTATDSDAERWIREVQEAGRESIENPPVGSLATVGGWVRLWLKQEYRETVRPITYQVNETSVRVHIESHEIAGRKLAELTAQEIRAWLSEIPSGAAIKNRALSNLKRALDYAVEEDQIAENPAAKVKKLTYKPKETPYLRPEQVWTYLDAVRGDFYEALYVVMATSGLRPSELLALRWSDYDGESLLVDESVADLGAGKFDPQSPKTDAGLRRVPLTEEGKRAIKEHRTRALERLVADGRASEPIAEKLIFPRPTDPAQLGYYSRHSILSRWSKAIKKAGLPHMPVYSLRHTTAMLYAYAGADLKTTQGVLGQSDPRTLIKTYQHFIEERAVQAARGVDGVLGERPK